MFLFFSYLLLLTPFVLPALWAPLPQIPPFWAPPLHPPNTPFSALGPPYFPVGEIGGPKKGYWGRGV